MEIVIIVSVLLMLLWPKIFQVSEGHLLLKAILCLMSLLRDFLDKEKDLMFLTFLEY